MYYPEAPASPPQVHVMYQSIPSLTIPPLAKPPGNFLMGEFPTPGQKRSSKPHPQAYKNEIKPHTLGIFLNYSL